MVHRRHTDREYAAELEQLRERVLLMGARVEEMLAAAIRALSERDVRLAQRTRPLDEPIDDLEVEIDQRALRILARWHPMASDLRFITGVLKLVKDLERTGDQAIIICRHAVELSSPRTALLQSKALGRLMGAAPAMLQEALDAFVTADAVRASNVIEKDDELDAAYAAVVPEILSYMKQAPSHVEAGTSLLAVSKALERVGDHATTIAGLVLFMIDGRDVRTPTPRPPGPDVARAR